MRTAFTIDYGLATVDCSIRKPSDRGSMAPPRRVSPPYTSFLGMNTLGIHCQLCSVVENKGSNGYVGLCSQYQRNLAVSGNLRRLADGFPLMMQLQIYSFLDFHLNCTVFHFLKCNLRIKI